MLPDRYVTFLSALVDVGRAKFGAAWNDAESMATRLAWVDRENDAIKLPSQRVHEAFADLLSAVVNKRVTAFDWWDGLTQDPFPLNVYHLASPGEAGALLSKGYLYRDHTRHHVLLDAESVKAFVDTYAYGPPLEASAFDAVELSPDMRLAMAVIKDWDITPGSSHTIAAIAARVQELAKAAGEEITDRRAEEIARTVKGWRKK